MSRHPDATAALLTPPGRGAVAVIQVIGPGAAAAIDRCFVAANAKPLAVQPIDAIRFGRWRHAGGEEVVVCRTAEQTTEIHCHGGDAASRAVLADLRQEGCRTVGWNDAGSARSLDQEAQAALAECKTDRAAAVLLDQLGGALARAVRQTQETLAAGGDGDAREAVDRLLALAPFGTRLTRGWRVVLAGRPNVGKSSLLNAVVGYQRAIVFDQPGVTRDVVTTATAIDGWPVELSDTAGLRPTADHLEAASGDRARDAVASADLVVLVEAFGDPTPPGTTSDGDLCESLGVPAPAQVLRVANKGDLAAEGGADPRACWRVSATTGEGLNALIAAIGKRLVPEPPAPGVAIPFTSRQEQLLAGAAAALAAGAPAEADRRLQALLAPSG